MAVRDEFGYTFEKLNIGTWDMDASAAALVVHTLSATEWKTVIDVGVIIASDLATSHYFLKGEDGAVALISSRFNLGRTAAGTFDDPAFATTPTIDGDVTRGWITFKYIPD